MQKKMSENANIVPKALKKKCFAPYDPMSV